MKHARSRSGALLALLTLGLLVASVSPPAQAFPARDRQAVVDHLRSITGKSIVSGQHNKEPASLPAQYTQQVFAATGQYPGLWGGDLMFNSADVAARQRVIDQAKTEWQNGSLVALSWHVCPPTMGSSCSFEGGVKSRITDDQFKQIVTDGTPLNTAWKRRLDEVVPYLQQLKDAGVPVLFRPLHEMNEDWNWWGKRPGVNGSARLFQITNEHLVGKGLDNLAWVWNVQDSATGDWASYYPGSRYVDVVSLDVWYKNHPSSGDYAQMKAIAGSKPIALAELGKVPDNALLTSQPDWAYFMVWSEQLRGNNTTAQIQSAYFHPRVLNQGEFAVAAAATPPVTTVPPPARPASGRIVGLAGKCVDAAGAGTVDGTAVQLYSCATGVAQTWTVRSDGTLLNPGSGKCLDVTNAGTANGTKAQLWTCNGTGAQRWTYDATARTLRNPGSGRCLDVSANSTADRTRLQIWDCLGGSNQRWVLPT